MPYFQRPILFDRINPSTTEDQAVAVRDKVKEFMANKPFRSVSSECVMGGRHFVVVMVEDEVIEQEAPPATIDGVFIAFSRLNSLDYWLGPKKNPPSPSNPSP